MKNLMTYLLLGASLSMPLSAMAAPDLDDVTMDVINLNDSHADAVMKQIDLPSMAARGEQERDDHSRSTKVNQHNDLSVKESENENKMSQERTNEMERENTMQQEQANEMEHENQMEQERSNEIERENTIQQDQQQQFDRDTKHGMSPGAQHTE